MFIYFLFQNWSESKSRGEQFLKALTVTPYQICQRWQSRNRNKTERRGENGCNPECGNGISRWRSKKRTSIPISPLFYIWLQRYYCLIKCKAEMIICMWGMSAQYQLPNNGWDYHVVNVGLDWNKVMYTYFHSHSLLYILYTIYFCSDKDVYKFNWKLGALLEDQHQHNYAAAGSVGSETAERLERPARPIVFFCCFLARGRTSSSTVV